MAGRGPAPKAPDKRAGHSNSDPQPLKTIVASPVRQPRLPVFKTLNPLSGRPVTFAWPAQTKTWWRMWGESPLSADFTETDWSFLLDTAILHARFWRGDVKAAAELRLRVAKFGATPEDRARLRIATAPTAGDVPDRPKRAGRLPTAYQGLRVVGDVDAVAGA